VSAVDATKGGAQWRVTERQWGCGGGGSGVGCLGGVGDHGRGEDGSEGVVAVDCGDAGWGCSGCCHSGGRRRLVVVLHVVDLIDRATRSILGFAGKSRRKKISGGGRSGGRWRPAGGRRRLPDLGEGEYGCVCVLLRMK
nr:hypothetical protein [Tanacetum cinerariifolium]